MISGSTQILLSTGYTLGLSNVNFILFDNLLVSFADRIALLPVVVLATTISPKGVEGFSFAALINLYDIAAVLSAFFTASLVSMRLIELNDFNFYNF